MSNQCPAWSAYGAGQCVRQENHKHAHVYENQCPEMVAFSRCVLPQGHTEPHRYWHTGFGASMKVPMEAYPGYELETSNYCGRLDKITGLTCSKPLHHDGLCSWEENYYHGPEVSGFKGMDHPDVMAELDRVMKQTEIPIYFSVRVEYYGLRPEQLIGIRAQCNGIWYRVMMYDEDRNVYVMRKDE